MLLMITTFAFPTLYGLPSATDKNVSLNPENPYLDTCDIGDNRFCLPVAQWGEHRMP
jgi:hypothetical protein